MLYLKGKVSAFISGKRHRDKPASVEWQIKKEEKTYCTGVLHLVFLLLIR